MGADKIHRVRSEAREGPTEAEVLRSPAPCAERALCYVWLWLCQARTTDAELEKEGREDMKVGDKKVAEWADRCPSRVGELS